MTLGFSEMEEYRMLIPLDCDTSLWDSLSSDNQEIVPETASELQMPHQDFGIFGNDLTTPSWSNLAFDSGKHESFSNLDNQVLELPDANACNSVAMSSTKDQDADESDIASITTNPISVPRTLYLEELDY